MGGAHPERKYSAQPKATSLTVASQMKTIVQTTFSLASHAASVVVTSKSSSAMRHVLKRMTTSTAGSSSGDETSAWHATRRHDVGGGGRRSGRIATSGSVTPDHRPFPHTKRFETCDRGATNIAAACCMHSGSAWHSAGSSPKLVGV